MWNRHGVRWLFLVVVASLLPGCGGGGGGGSISPPPPPPPPSTFSLSATVAGLDGTLVIQNNGANDQTVTSNGTVAVASGLASGATYNITVLTQPANPAQLCTVANGSGTLTANVTNVTITCANIPLALSTSTPAENSTGSARAVPLQLSFTRTLDAATVVPANITLSSSAGPEGISLSSSGSSVTVNHGGSLRPLTSYTLNVSTAVRGAAAEQLPTALALHFATSDAQWDSPTTIETGNTGNAYSPTVEFDSNGNGYAVWHQFDGTRPDIWAALYTLAGWSTPYTVEDSLEGASNPQIAVNAAHERLMVWQQYDGTRANIWGRYSAPTGSTVPTLLESGNLGNALDPQVVIDASGRGVVVFERSDGVLSNIYAKRFSGGAWGALFLVEQENAGSATKPQVAIDANGLAHIVWQQNDGTRNNIMANTLDVATATLGTAVLLETDNDGSANSPQIAIDPAGNALTVWMQNVGGQWNVYANRRPSDGAWGTAQILETGTGNAQLPQIAADASGNALAVWAQTDGVRYNIWANRYSVRGGWGTATLIENFDADSAYVPTVAFDPSGNALAAWRQFGASTDICVSRYSPFTGWGAPAVIGTAAESGTSPQLAFDQRGNALVMWRQDLASGDRVAAARFQ
jgi:hypothetical protein